MVSLRHLGLDLAEAGRLATMCATGQCDATATDLAARIPERRREVAAAMAELAHLDRELAAIEHALASGEPSTALCSRNEDC